MNSATIKTDRIANRFAAMQQCNPTNARFSCDWAEAQSADVLAKSLADCAAVFTACRDNDECKAEHRQLAAECLTLLTTYGVKANAFKVLDDVAKSFVAYQFERYAMRCIAAHKGDVREQLVACKPGFSIGSAPAKQDTKAPAKQDTKAPLKPPAKTPSKAPAKQDDGVDAKLDRILGLMGAASQQLSSIDTRLTSLEGRVTALESKQKRGRPAKQDTASAAK